MNRYKIIQKELIHRWIGAYLICHLEYKFYSNLFVRNKKNLLTKKMKTFYTMGVFVLIQVKSRSILILPLDSINRYSNNIIFYDLPHTTKIISNQQAGKTSPGKVYVSMYHFSSAIYHQKNTEFIKALSEKWPLILTSPG